jgi:hypothetical protein
MRLRHILDLLRFHVSPRTGRASRMGKSRKKPTLPKVRSLLDHYRQHTGRQIAAIEIDDPYATPQHETAALVARPGRGAADSPDAPCEWLAPRRERIKVMASTRDVVTGMFARRQIDDAMFQAARNYQRLHERAGQLGSVRSIDLSAPQVSGRLRGDFEHLDVQLRALHELQHVEAQLLRKTGEDGVALLRDVLGRGITVENAAKERGDDDEARVRWWGGTFRRCLRHLAEVTGFAVKNAYENIKREDARQDEQRRRQETNAKKRKKGGRREAQEEAVSNDSPCDA